jgi:hypothetical protein
MLFSCDKNKVDRHFTETRRDRNVRHFLAAGDEHNSELSLSRATIPHLKTTAVRICFILQFALSHVTCSDREHIIMMVRTWIRRKKMKKKGRGKRRGGKDDERSTKKEKEEDEMMESEKEEERRPGEGR